MREPLSFYMANQYALCHQKHYADPNQRFELLRIVKDTHPNIHHNKAMEKAFRFHRLMKAAATGKTVPHKGNQYTQLYTPLNDTFIQYFKITTDEERHLSSIISDDEKQRRDTKYHRNKRGSDKTQALFDDERKRVNELKDKGLSQRAIARETGFQEGPSSNT
ncbi:MAG: hypothetical protein ACJAU1_001647 [Psychromonas sp.]|jgi:hypothetical protein